MPLHRIAAVLALGAAIAGCDFKEGFDEGFDRNWKESFVKSCVKGAGPRVEPAMATQLCGCIADHMGKHLTRAELANPVSDRSEKVGEEATNVCVAKLVPQDER